MNLHREKRNRVLEAARHEFASQGYAGASMNRLSDVLGIAKGSLFKYFGSKEGCFRAVFDQGVADFALRMRGARAAVPEGASFAQRLKVLVLAALEFVARNPDIFHIYLKMRFHEDFPMRGAVLREVRGNVRRLLLPLLTVARETGELRPDLDVESTVLVLDAVIDRFLQEQALPVDGGTPPDSAPGIPPDEAFDTLMRMLYAGLAAREDLSGR